MAEANKSKRYGEHVRRVAVITPLAPRVSLTVHPTNERWPLALTGPWTGVEDPELFRHFGFICTDAKHDGPDDPRYRVSLATYANLEGELWTFTDAPGGLRTLRLAWPTRPDERARLERALLV